MITNSHRIQVLFWLMLSLVAILVLASTETETPAHPGQAGIGLSDRDGGVIVRGVALLRGGLEVAEDLAPASLRGETMRISSARERQFSRENPT